MSDIDHPIDDGGLSERSEAWYAVCRHPFFAECYEIEGALLPAMLGKLDRVHEYLVAVDQYDDHPQEDPRDS